MTGAFLMGERLALSAVFAYLPARKAGLDGTLVNPVRSGTKQPHASPCRVRFSLPLAQRPKSIRGIDFNEAPKSLAILGSAEPPLSPYCAP